MYWYLSSEKLNRERQPELDLAKFFSIFLMISCHCGLYFHEEGTLVYRIFDIIGGEFAAPVFMVCMGIGVVFSHHNKPVKLISRGLKLLLCSYALNMIRSTIPEVIFLLIDPSKQMFGIPYSIFNVDILSFAGCAMMLIGLFKQWKIEPVYQLMIGLLMTGMGEILAGISTGYGVLDVVCNLVWAANDWSFFPLLNWFIYPSAGVYFGEILMHCNNKSELYRRLLPIG